MICDFYDSTFRFVFFVKKKPNNVQIFSLMEEEPAENQPSELKDQAPSASAMETESNTRFRLELSRTLSVCKTCIILFV